MIWHQITQQAVHFKAKNRLVASPAETFNEWHCILLKSGWSLVSIFKLNSSRISTTFLCQGVKQNSLVLNEVLKSLFQLLLYYLAATMESRLISCDIELRRFSHCRYTTGRCHVITLFLMWNPYYMEGKSNLDIKYTGIITVTPHMVPQGWL